MKSVEINRCYCRRFVGDLFLLEYVHKALIYGNRGNHIHKRYPDFKPGFALEKLFKIHNIYLYIQDKSIKEFRLANIQT